MRRVRERKNREKRRKEKGERESGGINGWREGEERWEEGGGRQEK